MTEQKLRIIEVIALALIDTVEVHAV